jgi:3-hydroxybutyryl-CoA dehydrogenase
MKIGILASPAKQNAWMQKQTPSSTFSWVQDSKAHDNFDVFVDLDFDNQPMRIQQYSLNSQTIFVLGAVKCSLEQSIKLGGSHLTQTKSSGFKAIGINNLCSFIERNTLELTNPFELDPGRLSQIASALGYAQIEVVNSRVGLITPRVVCMIINEAFYTVQEGTATENDIDQAMKLGTNYPLGPFEWCNKIGLSDVYETLEALYQDTHDERYKICSLLKQRYLRN